MSDTSDAPTGDAPTAEAPTTQVAAEAAPSTTAPATDPSAGEAPTETSLLDIDLPDGMRSFDRDYVTKLRQEAAANRTKAREYEQQLTEAQQRLERYSPFEDYGEEDFGVWATLASDWRENPVVAAQKFQQIARNVLDDPTASDADKAQAQEVLDDPDITAAANEELTPEKIRELARAELEADKAREAQEAEVERIFGTLREAGYEDDSVEQMEVLFYTTRKTGGDIQAGIQMLKEREQRIIDNYVKRMAEGGTPVQIPSDGETGSPAAREPQDVKEAGRMARQWLAERNAAQQ